MQNEIEAKRSNQLPKNDRDSPQLKPTLFWGVGAYTSGAFPTLTEARKKQSGTETMA